jgi:hypothetical protein
VNNSVSEEHTASVFRVKVVMKEPSRILEVKAVSVELSASVFRVIVVSEEYTASIFITDVV